MLSADVRFRNVQFLPKDKLAFVAYSDILIIFQLVSAVSNHFF